MKHNIKEDHPGAGRADSDAGNPAASLRARAIADPNFERSRPVKLR